jgi:hypothetical protein
MLSLFFGAVREADAERLVACCRLAFEISVGIESG